MQNKIVKEKTLQLLLLLQRQQRKGCSHIRDQIAETFQPKKTTKNLRGKNKRSYEFIFLHIMRWIPFFFSWRQRRRSNTAHGAVCAQWKSRSWGSFFPGETATVSREITPAGKWHSAEHVIGRDVDSNRFQPIRWLGFPLCCGYGRITKRGSIFTFHVGKKKRTLFFFFFFLLKSVPFFFLFFYPSPNLLSYLPQTKLQLHWNLEPAFSFLFFSFWLALAYIAKKLYKKILSAKIKWFFEIFNNHNLIYIFKKKLPYFYTCFKQVAKKYRSMF